jgi:hypothetical protein
MVPFFFGNIVPMFLMIRNLNVLKMKKLHYIFDISHIDTYVLQACSILVGKKFHPYVN